MPVIGTPLGHHLRRRSLVCADPISWFLSGIISNPSAFILGQPGLGKTALVHRMLAVLADWGVIPLILADSKPDYVWAVERLGGQRITFSPGQGHINPWIWGRWCAGSARSPTPRHGIRLWRRCAPDAGP